jgi:polar amino acid transport system substrate-binding protein
VSILQSEKFKLDFALECADSLTWEYDRTTDIIVFSDEFDKLISGRQSDYNYNFTAFLDLHLKDFKDEILQKMDDLLTGKTDLYESEIVLIGSDKEPHWLIVRGKFIDQTEKLVYGVSVDITRRKKLEMHLEELAYVDHLTGLYRLDYLEDVVAHKVRGVNLTRIGLVILDICGFSNVEQAFDRNIADRVLCLTADRLKTLVGEQLLIHLNEDKFLVVFNDVDNIDYLQMMAHSVKEAFKLPLAEIEKSFYLDFDIGIALSDNLVIDQEGLRCVLQDAQFALRTAKENELSSICTITDDIRRDTMELLNMAYGMRHAIEQKEFFLQFQPIIGACSHKMVGCEALIRWQHPVKGLLNPLRFIPLAEEIGLIIKIGDFVLEEAMRHMGKWLAVNPGFYVAVNVSAIQFLSHKLSERLLELMNKYAIPPANLVIELTESAFISDFIYLTKTLNTLKKYGIRISLDDFGTGYSSLSYLKKLPIDNLKIDRAFLDDVLVDETARAMLKSIIALAKNLSLSITVEGVETKEQLDLLEKYGCDRLQGYYFSKPLSAEELEKWL